MHFPRAIVLSLAVYGPIPVARLSSMLAKERLLPYIRPVDEERRPLALMDYARLVLNHLDGLEGPSQGQVNKASVRPVSPSSELCLRNRCDVIRALGGRAD